jgi:hypothetical protein
MATKQRQVYERKWLGGQFKLEVRICGRKGESDCDHKQSEFNRQKKILIPSPLPST